MNNLTQTCKNENIISHGFPPLYNENSKILILGSFPSVKSREESFFYMHKENRFYKVLSSIYGIDLYNMNVDEKRKALLDLGIALYDSIESCSINGSSDSSIKDVTPADINTIIKNSKISKIYLNGRKSEEVFKKYFPELIPMSIYLPSTSPLNASYSLNDLINEWKIIKFPLNKALIFDLDGTLIDSYKVISESLYETVKHFNYSDTYDNLLSFIKKYSVKEYLDAMSNSLDVSVETLKSYYSIISNSRINEFTLIEGAKDLLSSSIKNGYLNMIYTHRGNHTFEVLKNLGIDKYFIEVLTSESGFKRKPSGDAIKYLVNRYSLDTNETFYIGDRKLDIDSGCDAKVKTIYLNESSLGYETLNVKSLDEIRIHLNFKEK